MKTSTLVLTSVVVFLVGGLAVLLTPLRFINLIEPQITEIAPTAFYAEFKAKPNAFMFVDVRPQSEYVAQHATGAVSMPLETLYSQRHYLPKSGKTIALICGGSQASGVGFSYLQHFGFFNIIRVTGGMPAWNAAGLPTVTGSYPNGNQATSSLSFLASLVKCT